VAVDRAACVSLFANVTEARPTVACEGSRTTPDNSAVWAWAIPSALQNITANGAEMRKNTSGLRDAGEYQFTISEIEEFALRHFGLPVTQ
jgi:hypothetical protein